MIDDPTPAPDPAENPGNEPPAIQDPEPSTEEAMLAALDEGLAEETPDPPVEESKKPDASDEPTAGDELTPELPPGAEPPKDGKPPEKSDEEKAVDEEVKALGLKEKAEARFRELTTQVRDLAPLREALEKAGIKDMAQLPQLFDKAKAADEFIGMVQETGATPEQYGQTLDYLALVNKAAKGDAKAADDVIAMWLEEGKALHANLGREMPGVHDPLEGHADLMQAVEDGDMTRKHALEVAQARVGQQQATRQQQAASQAQQQQDAQQQALDAGVNALKTWEAGKLADPNYQKLRPALHEKVKEIRQQFPPQQWAAATEYAYQAIAAQARAAAPPKPPPGPVRPTGPRPAMVPEFKSPEEALDFGINEASA